MNKMNKKVFIIEIALLIFIIMFKIASVRFTYFLWIGAGCGLLICTILYLILGYARDNNYFKKSTIRLTIVVLLLYFLTIYLMGLFLGYGYSKFDKNPFALLNNAVPLLIIICSTEFSRYLILSKSISQMQKIILTIELIILDIIIGINGVTLDSYEKIFIVCSTIILPIIANGFLCTYISGNVSYVPALIYHVIIELYVYIIPILPALGNYFISVFDITLPFMLYLQVRNNLKYREKYGLHAKKSFLKFGLALILTFLTTLVLLTSGVFKYVLVAIASESMEPTYYRGDAVLIEKKKPSDIKEGDILAFKTSIGIVTHRVIKIDNKNNNYIFTTKGDNNEYNDTVEIKREDVIGTVNYILKYAGMPTVMVKEIFERN